MCINVCMLVWGTARREPYWPQNEILYWSGWDWMMKMLTLSTLSAYLLVWHKHNASHQIRSSWHESSSFITVFYPVHQSASPALTAKHKMLADFLGCHLTAICSWFRVMGYRHNAQQNNYQHLGPNSGYIRCPRSDILVHTAAISGVALCICTEFQRSFITRN